MLREGRVMSERENLVHSSSHIGDTVDAQITADRYELKYVLVPEHETALLAEVAGRLARHVPQHGYPAIHSHISNHWEQRITTIYLDTTNYDIYRSCLSGEISEKLRIKEYRPGAGAGADRPAEALWLEIKTSSDTRSQKERVAVPRSVVQAALESGKGLLDSVMAATGDGSGDTGDGSGGTREESPDMWPDMWQRMWRIQRRYRSPLHATCIVDYRRRAWQDPGGQLRVTIDEGLRVSSPGTRALSMAGQSSAGVPIIDEHSKILEIKYRDALPPWLEDRLCRLLPARLPRHPSRPFSKFLAASEAVAASS